LLAFDDLEMKLAEFQENSVLTAKFKFRKEIDMLEKNTQKKY